MKAEILKNTSRLGLKPLPGPYIFGQDILKAFEGREFQKSSFFFMKSLCGLIEVLLSEDSYVVNESVNKR